MEHMSPFTCRTEARVVGGKPRLYMKTLLLKKLEGQGRGMRLKRRTEKGGGSQEEEKEENTETIHIFFLFLK